MQRVVGSLMCLVLLAAQAACACPPVALPTAGVTLLAPSAGVVCPAVAAPQFVIAAPVAPAALVAEQAAPRMGVRRRARGLGVRRSRTLSVTRSFSR